MAAPTKQPVSPTYRRIAEVLERYVSKIMVQAVLSRALEERRVTAQSLGPRDVKAVVEHAMVSLRLFCAADRLPDLMLALAEVCDDLEAAQPTR